MEASLSNTKDIDLPTTLPHSPNVIDIYQSKIKIFATWQKAQIKISECVKILYNLAALEWLISHKLNYRNTLWCKILVPLRNCIDSPKFSPQKLLRAAITNSAFSFPTELEFQSFILCIPNPQL